MKKILAILLSLAMLLGACAFAEEAEPVTHSHKISDMHIVFGNQVYDLSGLSLELDVFGTDAPSAARLHLDADGETAAELGVTVVDNYSILHLASESLGHVDYAIDPVVVLARALDEGVGGLVKLLQSVDTGALAKSMMDAIDKIGEEPEEPAPEAVEEIEESEEPEEQQPAITIEGDPVAAIMAGFSEPQSVQMGGVEYGPSGEINIADGTYTTQEFTIDTETLCTVLDMVYLDGQPSGWGDKVRESGVSFEINGSTQVGEAEGLNKVMSLTASFDVGQGPQTMAISTNTYYGEGGESITAMTYGVTSGEQAMGASFNLTRGQHEGDAFTPDSVDMDQVVVLTDMGEQEGEDALMASLTSVGLDAVGALVAPVMASMIQGAAAAAE